MYDTAHMIVPMGVWKLPKNKLNLKQEICNNGKYIAQLKKDGYWYSCEKTKDKKDYLFSKNFNTQGFLTEKSANVPHIIAPLHEVLPNDTVLAMEIYYPNKRSNNVTEIMGCLADKAIIRQQGEYGYIHAYIHDILYYNGKSLLNYTNQERNLVLRKVVAKHKLDTLSEYIEVAKTYDQKGLDKLIDVAIENGEEGMVLKKKNGLFVPNQRPAWNWIKFKVEDEHDVICIGYEPIVKEYKGKEPETWLYWENIKTGKITCNKSYYGNSKYQPVTEGYAKGWVGAIRMGVYKDGELVDIGEVHSGMPNSLFEEIKFEPDKFIGQPFLVRSMQVFEVKLRHAVFLRWRDDIQPKECTFAKIFD
jgi:ATP-dependent DNA ligase